MSRSIENHIRFVIAAASLCLLVLCMAVTILLAWMRGNTYRSDLADAAGSFAALTIDADAAKDAFTLRQTDEEWAEVQQTLTQYVRSSSGRVVRISLAAFSNSGGSLIFDTDGAALGTRLDYDDYTSSVRTELLNGREEWYTSSGNTCTLYRPLRTVDDRLTGYLIVTVQDAQWSRFAWTLAGLAGGLLLLLIAVNRLLMRHLKKHLFKPLQSLTDAALRSTGSDADADTDTLFATGRSDEIGQLGQAIRKMFTDISTGAENLSEAVYAANHDGMTGMLNKRCYAAMEERFKGRESLCAVYFDVNNLKLMNDTLGHEQGDLVIKRAADYIRSFMTASDYCFRMGGDEFLLIMTDCSLRTIAELVEKLDANAPYLLNRERDEVHCALSYGYEYAKGSYVYEDLLAKAEQNMYVKKNELKELMQMPER